MDLEELVEARLRGEKPEVPPELRAEFDRAVAGHEAIQLALGETILVPEGAVADRSPPDLPGDYEIVRELGRGGMGVVYLARQRSLDRQVAVKVLRPGEQIFGPMVQRFLEEARRLARLRHPNIVSIHEIGRTGREPYFTMDYVEGEPLSAVLARERLSPSRALAILKQAAAGVQHAHENGIIHRDLKPGNILLDAAGRAYVTDFGLARDLTQDSGLTRSGQIVGTPAYMAPEQARGRTELIGETTDVHALGVVLYEMLTGRPPYGSDAAADVLVRLLQQEPVPPRRIDRRIPRDLETILMKAMAKEPDRRYPTAQALLEEIRRFESGEPVHARRPGPVRRLARFSRRHWRSIAAAAAVLLVLVFGPRLFDRSPEELIALGDDSHDAGVHTMAVAAYRRALERTFGSRRVTVLRNLVRCCQESGDETGALDAALLLVEEEPDDPLGELDYLVAQALVARARASDPNRAISGAAGRPLLELAAKRLEVFLGGGRGAEKQREEAWDTLDGIVTVLDGGGSAPRFEQIDGGGTVEADGWWFHGGGFLRDGAPGALFGMRKAPGGRREFAYLLVFRHRAENADSVERPQRTGPTFDGRTAVMRDGITIDGTGVELTLETHIDPATGEVTGETMRLGRHDRSESGSWRDERPLDPSRGRVILVDLTEDRPPLTQFEGTLPDDLPDPGDPETIRALARKVVLGLLEQLAVRRSLGLETMEALRGPRRALSQPVRSGGWVVDRYTLPEGTVDELRALARDAERNPLDRGRAAYAAGLALEGLGDAEGALGEIRRAYELIRSVWPTYSGLQVGMNVEHRESTADPWECALLRDVFAALERLDPSTPDMLRGGLRFRVIGFRIPRELLVALKVELCDPAIPDPDRGREGTRVGRPVNIGLDHRFRVGVADGRYRLSVGRYGIMWGDPGTGEVRRIARLLELDLEELPEEVEVEGEMIEMPPIRARLLQEIALVEPAAGARVDLTTHHFRWTELSGAVRYDVRFGYMGAGASSSVVMSAPAETEAPTLCLGEYRGPHRERLVRDLTAGRTGIWEVEAFDAAGRRIGRSVEEWRPFLVARGLEP